MINKYEIMMSDLEDLTHADIMVMVASKNRLRTEIQKLALIYNCTANKYTDYKEWWGFHEGFSDEIEESIGNLRNSGIITEYNERFTLSNYGKELLSMIKIRNKETFYMIESMQTLCHTLRDATERFLTGMTHHFFPDVSVNPSIAESVGIFNSNVWLDDVKLLDTDVKSFVKLLFGGCAIGIRYGGGAQKWHGF